MTRELRTGRRAPRSGETKSVVAFLHGYGADGADLLGLADPLAPHLPDTEFFAPNAPDPCLNNPMGYQWFPIPRLDGSDPVAAGEAMARSVADLDAWIDGILAQTGVPASKLVLFGFSQGTMMSLHVAPRRPQQLAGVIGFSGRLIAAERLKEEIVTHPPILLVHGDMDEMVPPASLPEAADALTAAGVDVYAHVMEGTGHGISPDGLGVALGFLRQFLGYEKP